ncbi:MAG TPA: zf-HC2 domain-containing protein, partial [Gemmatimonadaceae bacterium]|nr:zf-HC2 domain-containing protein [Gemmatimonadaceae bacterium]
MQHLDEGTIHAWLDGALGADEAARVDAHVASCARCADAVAEARGLIAASSRILTALDQVPSIRGSQGSRGSRGSTGSRWTGRPFATAFARQRIAAVIALIVVGGAVALTVARKEPSRSASEAAPMAAVVVADAPAPVSTTPAPMQATMPRRESDASASRGEPGRGGATPAPRVQAFEVARQADSAPPATALSAAPLVAADVAAPPSARVTDTVPEANVVAQAERKVE